MESNNQIECPCPKECPRHGRCRECVAHHKAVAVALKDIKPDARPKLPVCLRGINWGLATD